MASIRLYGRSMVHLLKNHWSWDSGVTDVYVALLKSTYIPDMDEDESWSDVSEYEVTSGGTTGYVSGGVVATLSTPAYSASANMITLDAADLLLENITTTARYLLFYKLGESAAASWLIGLIDMGTNQISSGNDMTITFSADGIFRMRVAE